jgi:hypothetical protein
MRVSKSSKQPLQLVELVDFNNPALFHAYRAEYNIADVDYVRLPDTAVTVHVVNTLRGAEEGHATIKPHTEDIFGYAVTFI